MRHPPKGLKSKEDLWKSMKINEHLWNPNEKHDKSHSCAWILLDLSLVFRSFVYGSQKAGRTVRKSIHNLGKPRKDQVKSMQNYLICIAFHWEFIIFIDFHRFSKIFIALHRVWWISHSFVLILMVFLWFSLIVGVFRWVLDVHGGL